MAVVATQSMPLDGSALTFAAASAGGDRFTPAVGTIMQIVNGSGASITATLVTPGTVDGLAVADRAVTVPAGTNRLVPLRVVAYQSADGLGDITWSATATVTFAVVNAVV